jgi:hypothetical protein
MHLALAGVQIAQDLSRVRREVVIVEAMREIGDRSAFITRRNIKEF